MGDTGELVVYTEFNRQKNKRQQTICGVCVCVCGERERLRFLKLFYLLNVRE